MNGVARGDRSDCSRMLTESIKFLGIKGFARGFRRAFDFVGISMRLLWKKQIRYNK